MGTWTYSNDGQQADCADKPGTELSVGSCDGLNAHVVIRTGRDGDATIGAIHVPADVIPAMVWNLITYGGAEVDDVLDHIAQQVADSAVPPAQT